MGPIRAAACALVLAAIAAPVAAAAPAPQPHGTNDGGGFRDVLPPGTNGRANALELAAFLSAGARPEHNDDQLGMYGDLVYAVPGLGEQDLSRYFKDSTFGVPAGEEGRVYSPREDVTIVRDRAFGVPHVYGSDRIGAMFGVGYATAEDRLFFIDVLRHVGRAQLASFAGGAAGNRQMDRDQWRVAPYTEADLQRQIDAGLERYGEIGALVKADADAYIAGINRYIAEARMDPSKMPGEYPAIGRPQGPDDFKLTDIIATAGLVGGIFGKGGGGEIGSALTREAFLERFGSRRGHRAWQDFRSEEDPEAPTIVKGRRFPYLTRPANGRARGVAIPDRGSFKREPVVVQSSDPPDEGRRAQAAAVPREGVAARARGMLGERLQGALGAAFPSSASNFLAVSARESQSGRPLAVMGPQTGYFAPQILMEQEIHAPAAPGKPGIDAAGAAFPGVNLYVELGHGRDYAWSATSAGNDIIDTWALPLCDPGGGEATLESTGYRFRGECHEFEVLDRTNSWQPNLADSTPAGSETIRALRTRLGLVAGRATRNGEPVVYVYQRTTYMHEVDNAVLGFLAFNTPEMIKGPEDFQQAAYRIGYTFNWVYADHSRIAYFNSGDNPVRARRIDPRFPVDGRHEWRGYEPDSNRMRLEPFARHPQAIDQPYLVNWNGKQARGYRANDGNYAYGPVDRGLILEKRIRAGIRGDRKMTLAELVDAMGDGGTVDLRGQEVLPWVLRMLRRARDPELREPVALLGAWMRSGAHRRDRDRDGRYDDADAVALMDAWWPRLLEAQFMPALGEKAFEALRGVQRFHDDPHGHLGSAFDDGWYGFVQKDLRMLLRPRSVRGRWSRTYCGGTRRRAGSVGRCARALAASLKESVPVAADRDKLYSGSDCAAGDQICWDEVRFRPLGGVTQPPVHWINRPTYQQAVEVQRAVPREPGSPFSYPPR